MSKAAEAEGTTGAELTGATEAGSTDIPLGSRDPDNPARRRVRSLTHPGGPRDRFVSIPGAGPSRWAEIEAAGWIKPCPSCAARKKDILPLATGSSIDRADRDESGDKARATCGICDLDKHFAYLSMGDRQTGFCPECQPWAAVGLQPEDYEGESAERDRRYARINQVRAMLRGEAGEVPPGPLMPFWALVKLFAERYPQAAPESPGASETSETKHLLLFFGDKPIGEFVPESATEFTDSFLKGSNRRGPRAPASARPPLELLRRMLRFAKERGWVEVNPLLRGVALGPAVPLYKDDRIITREEEMRLHAACEGKFSYLLPVLIYVADAPAYLRDFLKLRWADVDFENNLIPGHRGLVGMTARLSETMQSLRGSGYRAESPVISRTVDQCNYDFEKVRAAANVEGLRWTDIRRTGAWRMERAGQDARQIAARLGMSHLDNVAELLRVDPVRAKQETDLPDFEQFALALFGGAMTGNAQKKGGKERRQRKPITTVNGKTLDDLNASILKRFDEVGVNSLVTLEWVADDAGLGRLGRGDGGAKNVSRLLKRNQVTDSFPLYRDRLIAERRSASNPVP